MLRAPSLYAGLEPQGFCLDRAPITSASAPSLDDDHEVFLTHQRFLSAGPVNERKLARLLLLFCEQNGQMSWHGLSSIELALDEMARHHRHRLAVNVSGAAASEPAFADNLAALLKRHKRAAHRLTLELTDSQPVTDIAAAITMMKVAHTYGVAVHIDDIESMNYHKDPLHPALLAAADGLKIGTKAHALVHTVHPNGVARRDALIALAQQAHAAGKTITLEGVGSSGYVDEWRDAGLPVDRIQIVPGSEYHFQLQHHTPRPAAMDARLVRASLRRRGNGLETAAAVA